MRGEEEKEIKRYRKTLLPKPITHLSRVHVISPKAVVFASAYKKDVLGRS